MDYRAAAIAFLKQCQENRDAEKAHQDADDTLCSLLVHLGYEDVVKEWQKVRRWYG